MSDPKYIVSKSQIMDAVKKGLETKFKSIIWIKELTQDIEQELEAILANHCNVFFVNDLEI